MTSKSAAARKAKPDPWAKMRKIGRHLHVQSMKGKDDSVAREAYIRYHHMCKVK